MSTRMRFTTSLSITLTCGLWGTSPALANAGSADAHHTESLAIFGAAELPTTVSHATESATFTTGEGAISTVSSAVAVAPSKGTGTKKSVNVPTTPHYRVVMDAGSSGSRLYVYQVTPNKYDDLPEIVSLGSKSGPALSSYDNDPASAQAGLTKMLNFAKEKVPEAERKATTFNIYATAGMRMVPQPEKQHILSEVDAFFSKDGSFSYQGAKVLQGSYEGLYSWMTLNYSDDKFDPAKSREGILEMGGASTQIAFVQPAGAPAQEKPIVRSFRGKAYPVFSRSYLYMGGVEATGLTTDSTCFPKDYAWDFGQGTGDFNGCSNHIQERFDSFCQRLENSTGPHCIFAKPVKAPASVTFFAIPAFKDTLQFFNLSGQIKIDELKKVGTSYCSTDWNTLVTEYSKTLTMFPPDVLKLFLKTMCFNSAYFHTLITKGFGVTEVTIPDKLDDSWTVGAVLDMSLGHKPEVE